MTKHHDPYKTAQEVINLDDMGIALDSTATVFAAANEINDLWRQAIERKIEQPDCRVVAAIIHKYLKVA